MITTKTEYLLKILISLVRRGESGYVASAVIASETGIPPKYIPQLMSVLTRKGWVESMRGANGGVKLAISPDDVCIMDVVSLVEDSFLLKKCLDSSHVCGLRETCALWPVWKEAQSKVEEIMRSVTLSRLSAGSPGKAEMIS